MFTGIIKSLGKIKEITTHNSNKTFWIESDITPELQVDESVAHNGVCLTIEEIKDNCYRITAIAETLKKSNLGNWNVNDILNLEHSLKLSDILSGHIVQGHVDCTAVCTQKKDANGSFEFTFLFNEKNAGLVIEKGSVCVNGVSLTAFNVTKNSFTVAIIPYTFTNTNFNNLQKGSFVNIEFDILGKYVQRIINLNEKK